MEQPEKICLSEQEAQALIDRIKSSSLSQADTEVMSGLISFNLWLQNKLARAQLTIRKLKNLFGFKTEKKVQQTNKFN